MYKIGDKVEYTGSNHYLQKQYAGILEIWEIAKNQNDGFACLTPCRRRVTSWIEAEDLKLIKKASLKLCTSN
jgi:hypothetical protein